MKIRARHIFAGLFLLIALVPITAMAIPGPQRMMAPGFFGFEEVSENVYSHPSMPEAVKQRAISDIIKAEKTVAEFFRSPVVRPNIILCLKEECNPVFGRKDVRGVAYGKRVIRLNNKGIDLTIATHELMHTALKRRVGEFRTYFGAVPAWFDEGLAVMISGDERFQSKIPDEALEALLKQHNWWEWDVLIQKYGWRDIYGGAYYHVVQLEKRIGRDGLLKIIDRVAKGESFNEVLADVAPPVEG